MAIYIHLQVRYNLFVQFYNICIRTLCFIPSNMNKLLYIPRYVNGMLLKTLNHFTKIANQGDSKRIYIFISTFYTIFITQALSTRSLLVY